MKEPVPMLKERTGWHRGGQWIGFSWKLDTTGRAFSFLTPRHYMTTIVGRDSEPYINTCLTFWSTKHAS